MQAKKTSGLLVTLKKNREYGFVYRRGKSCGGHYMVLLCVFRKYGGLKAGFSVSKKVGNRLSLSPGRLSPRPSLPPSQRKWATSCARPVCWRAAKSREIRVLRAMAKAKGHS